MVARDTPGDDAGKDTYPTRHSSTPSSAVAISPTDPTGVRSMFCKCASVAPSLAGMRASARAIGLGAQHHHAVLDLALAAVDHRKALDLAFAGGLVDELRHLVAVAVGLGLHAGVLLERLLGGSRDSTSP